MSERIGAFCLVGTLAVASIGACRQLAGISDSPPEALTSNVCGLPYGTSECAACVNTSCCSESTTCAADTGCAAYEGCLGHCNGDAECRSQCTIDHPVGVATDVTALSTCIAASCESACGLTCGGIADLISPPSAARACEQCLATTACPKAEACASSKVCDAYTRASYAFSTGDSNDVFDEALCASDAAAGLSLNIGGAVDVCGSHAGIDVDAAIATVADSFRFACATACATGNYWACVGHVNWPPPKAATCTIGYSITDYVTGAPVSDALVQVCSPSDDNCAEPLAHGMTDANGSIPLTVPNALVASGSLGLNGFTRISGPNVFTTNLYWGFPLVEGSVPYLHIDVATPAETQQLFADVKVTQVEGRGQLSVLVGDCLYQSAAGVNVTLKPADALTMGFSRTGTVTTVTGDTGLIFFVNVPAGVTTITATPGGLRTPSAQANVYVQPGMQTIVYMWKTPTQ
jgi:hypothetical protein